MAADLSINPMIKNLPNNALQPKQFSLPDNKTMEWYLEQLKQKADQEKGKGKGKSISVSIEIGEGGGAEGTLEDLGKILDNHDMWDGSGVCEEEKRQIIEDILTKTKQKMNSHRSVPKEVEASLEAIAKSKTKNWQRVLSNWCAKHINGISTVSTWSKKNKRYGFCAPGNKLGKGRRIVVGIDTSGSMSTEDLNYCISEIQKMVKQGIEGMILMFDTKVHTKIPLKKKQKYECNGRGGTDFVDFFEEALKYKADGVVLFTDGDDGGNCFNPGIETIFVYTNGKINQQYKWGQHILLDK
jgi:predicted metal-dependent peptidase